MSRTAMSAVARKRMATVGAVYDLASVPRCPADILARGGATGAPPTPAPVAKDKWLMASVENDAATVVARVFDEAWNVAGAEAVLKLRALRANDDFPAYQQFHLSRELQRVHQARFADGVIPTAA